MDSTLELWAYVLSNIGAVAVGSLLTALSFLAYRRNSDQASYRFATLGFGLIVLGTLVDPAYFLWLSIESRLTFTEILLLQVSEDLLFAAGLGLLFYAILRFDTSTDSTADNPASSEDELLWNQQSQNDD
ncbi:DUF7521 family protein [Natronococcus jeotgali]|uniref:Uncharacterized protein n=1 Tax=Natronococcus jeotgali DSM 18795 TaxID=1227498 RepID=L9X9I3_9EURY|nr:hypothetical protein [Natronococcus jeotgali]ELY58267.1 hypothetical protein C492_12569 [Natronococcus jeotgali DSM 18795]